MMMASLGILLLAVVSVCHGRDLAIKIPDMKLFAYNGTSVTFDCLFNTTADKKAIVVTWLKKQSDLYTTIWTSNRDGDEAESELFAQFFYSAPIAPPTGYSHAHSLVLKSAKLRDAGTYVCQVTDAVDDARAPALLTVCMENADICNGRNIKPPSPPMTASDYLAELLIGSVFAVIFGCIIMYCVIDASNDRKRKQWKSVLEDEPK